MVPVSLTHLWEEGREGRRDGMREGRREKYSKVNIGEDRGERTREEEEMEGKLEMAKEEEGSSITNAKKCLH